MTKRHLILGLLPICLILFFATGCNSEDDSVIAEKTGAVSLYVDTGVPTKASGGITADEMNVTFTSFVLFNSGGSDSVTLADADNPLTIDFLNFTFESLVDTFQVPVGSYNCVEMEIDSVTTVQGANTCPAIDPDLTDPMGAICLESGILVVEQDGSYEILLEAPLYSISCSKDNGTATVTIDEPGISIP